MLTAVGVFSVWRWRLGRSIDAKIAAIRAAGLPVDWQELSRWPTLVPDFKNAALIYGNAITQLNDRSIDNTLAGAKSKLEVFYDYKV